VDLLVLSACQTAAGDDRAALGLAGVAIKAGARSALATLWFVNDESTSVLVTELYRQFRESPSLSKAQALQAAQVAMLHDRRFRHPCYWSPYLLIGNWL
jgi:CHAT domain-containing protein